MKTIENLKNLNQNNKIVLKNTFYAFAVKGGGLIVSLLTLPAFMRFFGDEVVLGVWYTVLSVITWILNFDLGIGNGLRNRLVESIAKGDDKRSKELISSAYFSIGALVLVITAAGYILSGFINWNTVFNISTELVSNAVMLKVVRCVFGGIMLQFFLRLISSILYALQKSAVNNFIALISNILILIFVLIAPTASPEQNLLLLSAAYIIITALPNLVATIIIFSTSLKKTAPSIKFCNVNAIKAVMGIGGVFFVCQILYMVIVNTNDFFITYFVDPSKTVDYNIYNRLYSLPGTVISLALTPIWSVVTKAIAENDKKWIQGLYKKALTLIWFVVAGEIVVTVFLQFVINIWLGENAIQVNYLYAAIFAAWGSLFIFHNVLSTFACGTGNLKLQMICYSLGVTFKIAFLIIVFNFTSNWIYVVISNIVLLLPYCILQHISLKKQFSTEQNHSGKEP